ncbi:MAG TPA: hypothetical protein EYP85_10300 [Armatimonadetes bacterium]|nr:hypothetical protein [Armatimonadota bacterium]
MKTQGRKHPGNTLNDLTGKEWIKFTRSWFVCDSPRYWQNKDTELHPARYPEELVHEFLRFFTKRGGTVLDPFVGSGATLIACGEAGRRGVGWELNAHYVEVVRRRLAQADFALPQHVLQADARELGNAQVWQQLSLSDWPAWGPCGLPLFDFIITSPPYWNMLRQTRGRVFSKQQQRRAAGLSTYYSDDPADLGNIADYDEFIETLGQVFDAAYELLKRGKYLVVVVQNVRVPEGEVKPLAWDLQHRLSRRYLFQGERIWCQAEKPLGVWGYPTTFVPNYHHHYCLIFRKGKGGQVC